MTRSTITPTSAEAQGLISWREAQALLHNSLSNGSLPTDRQMGLQTKAPHLNREKDNQDQVNFAMDTHTNGTAPDQYVLNKKFASFEDLLLSSQLMVDGTTFSG